jgi:hypothetical protein
MRRYKTHWHLIALGALAVGTLGTGCEQPLGNTVQNLQSLSVVLKSPSPDNLGTADNPISPTEVVFDVRAIDSNGRVYAEDLEADVFLAFSGNRVGQLTACGHDEDKTPLAHIQMRGGVATDVRAPIARYYGKVALWVEQQAREGQAVRAFGASPEMTFRSPTIPDIQKPLDVNGPTATYCTPFNGKQITVVNGTGTGQLVVTSVYPNAYVVTDTGAQYDRATDQGGYNSLYVFTFGSPPFFIQPGRVLGRVGGNISKFVGFTELNFPYQDPASVNDLVQVPEPFVLLASDRGRNIFLLRQSASVVKTTARVCPIDVNSDDWKKFNQFALYFSDGVCNTFNTFQVGLPSKLFGTFDPLANQTKSITVTGALRNFSGQNPQVPETACTDKSDCTAAGFPTSTDCVEGLCRKGAYNFWTILPRTPSDIVLN